MNHIDVKNIKTQYGYDETYWVIDGVSLPTLLNLQVKDTEDDYIKSFIKSFDGLCPAWDMDLEWWGEVRFVWKLIDMDSVPLPLLLCPEDADFSCIVIVADVEKTKDFVYWNRIGYVLHDNEDFETEKESGILSLENYSDEDWEKYGDNIATEKVDSEEWVKWIGENWDEEVYRRRMNYTLPYYKEEGNVKWFVQPEWVFDRHEYECMVDRFKTMQRKEYLNHLNNSDIEKIDIDKCAEILAKVLPNGEALLKEHNRKYGEVLLHVLASEMITEPLIKLMEHSDKNTSLIELYFSTIKFMWNHGNDDVVNVVEVTILERLTDAQIEIKLERRLI